MNRRPPGLSLSKALVVSWPNNASVLVSAVMEVDSFVAGRAEVGNQSVPLLNRVTITIVQQLEAD